METATTLQLVGAGLFGAVIGWLVYIINRYRKDDVQFSDLVTIIGIIGGGAILTLFPQGTDLFGAYGIGLFGGFFAYFLTLLALVGRSKAFNSDWFLDGRRRKVGKNEFIPGGTRETVAAMTIGDDDDDSGSLI